MGRKKRSTERLVHRKGRPSGGGRRAILPTLIKKGRVRGDARTLLGAPTCPYGALFLGYPRTFFWIAHNVA